MKTVEDLVEGFLSKPKSPPLIPPEPSKVGRVLARRLDIESNMPSMFHVASIIPPQCSVNRNVYKLASLRLSTATEVLAGCSGIRKGEESNCAY